MEVANSIPYVALLILLGIVTYAVRRQEARNKALEIQLEAMRGETEVVKGEAAEATAQAASVQGALGAVNTLAGGITELARNLPAAISKLGQDIRTTQAASTQRLERAIATQSKVMKDYVDEVRSTHGALLTTLDRSVTLTGNRLDHMETNLKTEMARIRQEFIELENQVRALPRSDGEMIVKAITEAINHTGERILSALEKRQSGEDAALLSQPIVQ